MRTQLMRLPGKWFVFACAGIVTFSLMNQLKADLLSNGDFETMGASSSTFFSGGPSAGSASAAADWFVWHNQNGTTETNWLTYDAAGIGPRFGGQDTASDHLLRVEASHANNGLVNVFSPLNTGPPRALGSIWIYVANPGTSVGIGLGNGGSTVFNHETTHTGWAEIQLDSSPLNPGPVNELVVYANTPTGGTEFYVDAAFVTAVPEPASAGLLSLVGLAGFAGLGRRRKRR